MTPVTNVIKTLVKKNINWENVNSRLMEEDKALSFNNGLNRASTASSGCTLCHRPGQKLETYCLKSLKPDNKLHLSKKKVSGMIAGLSENKNRRY